MGVPEIIGYTIGGLLTPVLIPVAIGVAIVGAVKEKSLSKRIRKWEQEHQEKVQSIVVKKITPNLATGNFAFLDLGLRNQYEDEIGEIEVESDLEGLPVNIEEGMVLTC